MVFYWLKQPFWTHLNLNFGLIQTSNNALNPKFIEHNGYA